MWDTIKNGILMSDFTTEARILLTIIYSRVSPSTNLMNFLTMCAQMVACPLYNILLNVGHFMLMKIRHYKNKGGLMIIFPSLIMELCRKAGVDEYLEDS